MKKSIDFGSCALAYINVMMHLVASIVNLTVLKNFGALS